jgi:hypothetical protein
MAGKFSARRHDRWLSFFGSLAPPPTALEVAGDLDKEERHDGRSDSDLGTGLTGCDGGIDERPREEVLLLAFPLLPPARPKSRGG